MDTRIKVRKKYRSSF